jgi:hypothetical protein
MMQTLIFTPLLPWPALIAIALIAAAIALWGLAARSRGAGLRLAGLALLIMALSGPSLLTRATTPLADIALVLLDQSPSMQIGQRLPLQARALAALRAIAGATQLHIVIIPPASSGGTSLTEATTAALAEIAPARLAGIIAITDGQVTAPPPVPAGVPLSALLTAAGEETDRELHVISAPSFGLVGQTVPLTLSVRDHGASGHAPATVTVMEDDQPVATLPISPDTPLTIPIPVRHAGPLLVTASVTPLPGAVTDLNTSTAFTLTGIHKRLNILLISGSPDMGERAWRVLLRADPTVQSVHFTILRTPREAIDADERDLALVPFPVRELFEQDITKFDLIILDGFDAAGVLPTEYLANIASYVQNGGALLAEVGPEFAGPDSLAGTPLASILPAAPDPPGTVTESFTPTVTALGTRHPVTAPFAGQPLPAWFREVTAHATAGQVLMTGPAANPLLILADTGKGRIGMILSDQLWLWTRAAPHTGPALPLLRRIVHWLLREPSLEAESLAADLVGNRLTVTRQTLSPTPPGPATITIGGPATSTIGGPATSTIGGPATSTTNQAQRLTLALTPAGPGRYTGSLALPATLGLIKTTQGVLTAYAATSPQNPQEFEDLAATAQVLQPAARNIVWLGRTPAPALPTLITPRHAAQTLSTRRVPLLPPLSTLAVALLLAAAAWWRERS